MLKDNNDESQKWKWQQHDLDDCRVLGGGESAPAMHQCMGAAHWQGDQGDQGNDHQRRRLVAGLAVGAQRHGENDGSRNAHKEPQKRKANQQGQICFLRIHLGTFACRSFDRLP